MRPKLETILRPTSQADAEAPAGGSISALGLSPTAGIFPGIAPERRLGSAFEAELQALQRERDPELFNAGLLRLALRLERDGRSDIAEPAYRWLKDHGSAACRETALQRLTLLSGEGSFGDRFEALSKNFAGEAGAPATLLAMAAGGGVYRATRLATMSRLAGRAGFLGRGLGLKMAGGLAGFALEAPVFTWVGRAGRGQRLFDVGIRDELLSSYLVLGGMKGMGSVAAYSSRGWTNTHWRAWFENAGLYGGVMLGHGLEAVIGLRSWRGGGREWVEGLATLFHLKASGRILNGIGGEGYRRAELELDFRARRLAEWGEIDRMGPANDGRYPGLEPAANGPHRQAVAAEWRLAAGAEWSLPDAGARSVKPGLQVFAGEKGETPPPFAGGGGLLLRRRGGGLESPEPSGGPTRDFARELLDSQRQGLVPSRDALLWLHKQLAGNKLTLQARDNLALGHRSIRDGDLESAWEILREIVEGEADLAEWVAEAGHLSRGTLEAVNHGASPEPVEIRGSGSPAAPRWLEITPRRWAPAEKYDYYQQKKVEVAELDELHAAWLAGGGRLLIRQDALLPEIFERMRGGLPLVKLGDNTRLVSGLWGACDLGRLNAFRGQYRGNLGQVEMFRDLAIVLNRPRLGLINSRKSWGDPATAKRVFVEQGWNRIHVRWQEYYWYKDNVAWSEYPGREGYERLAWEKFDGDPALAFRVASAVLDKASMRSLNWGGIQPLHLSQKEAIRQVLLGGIADKTALGPEGYDRIALERFGGDSAKAMRVARTVMEERDFERLGWGPTKRSKVQDQGSILDGLLRELSAGTIYGPEGYAMVSEKYFGGDAQKAHSDAKALLGAEVFERLGWGVSNLTRVGEQAALKSALRAGVEDGSFVGMAGYDRFAELHCYGDLLRAFRVASALLSEAEFSALRWGPAQFIRVSEKPRLFEELQRGAMDGRLVGIQAMVDFANRELGGNVFKAARTAKSLLPDELYKKLGWSIRKGEREIERRRQEK